MTLNIINDDPRIEEILNLIQKYISGNYDAKGYRKGYNDRIDEIITALNKLSIKLSIKHFESLNVAQRLNEIINEITIFSSPGFPAKKSEDTHAAIISAITEGLNMLSIELYNSAISRDYIESIINSMADALFVLSSDCKIQKANQAAIELLGYSENELIGQSIEIILIEKNGSKKYCLEEALRLGENSLYAIKNQEIMLKTKTGEIFPANISCSIFEDNRRKTNGIISIIRDMRENELILKLKETTAQLIQTEKFSAIGELTSGIAHELNQPLNTISIICQSILRDIEKERFDKTSLSGELKDIINHVNKMSEIIDHMRIFTRKTNENNQKKYYLNDIVDGTLKFIHQQLIDHDITLNQDLGENLPKIICNPIHLEQALLNLITNARHAVEQNKIKEKKIKINTFLDEGGNHIILKLSDNGIGIPEKYQDKIFSPFCSTSEPGKGIGLGLSVTKKIIEEHNGKITFESKINEGTIFKIILPVYREAT